MSQKRKCALSWVTPSADNLVRQLPQEVAAVVAVYLADLVREYREMALYPDSDPYSYHNHTMAQLDDRARALGLQVRRDDE